MDGTASHERVRAGGTRARARVRRRVLERFLAYVRYDTTARDGADERPSSRGQLELGSRLMAELGELGLADISRDEAGRVFATLLSNLPAGRTAPAIGLIAHLDTSPDVSGRDVKPIVHRYRGGGLVLPGDPRAVIPAAELAPYRGDEVVTSDGATLLGADDKAGVAEVMAALELLRGRPDIPHGAVRVAFTTDEEVGLGAEGFDVAAFGADLAFTVDGGAVGELEAETFNAAAATFTIRGLNVHPGHAKGRMRNAILVAAELVGMLPPGESPASTEGREGYYHPTEVSGTVESATLKCIVRDFEAEGFERRKALLRRVADELDARHGAGTVVLDLKESYRNMREALSAHPEVVALAERAMREAGVEPRLVPVRGGTDGARLSFEGLPTPDLFTGGHNPHSRLEFVPVGSMAKAVEVIVNLVRLAGEGASGPL